MAISSSKEFVNDGFSKLLWWVFDWIYPPLCIGCGKIGFELCERCRSEIKLMDMKGLCKICGKKIHDEILCFQCQQEKPHFDEMRSWGIYSGLLKEIIQSLKYERRIRIINSLVQPLRKFFNSWNPEINIIVPVALGDQRQKSRGYNQSALLARLIAQILDTRFSTSTLKRTRETQSQVGLNAVERKKNVADAFSAEKNICKDKKILLVDDITTTGSTMNECARALKTSGVQFVYSFTLARTLDINI